MANVGSVTRQIAALELSNKKPGFTTNTARPPSHSKQPSQTNVAKLLTKYAAPNSTRLTKPVTISKTNPSTLPDATQSVDIGCYDGGLESENEKRGEQIFGEAAKELALDSSSAQ